MAELNLASLTAILKARYGGPLHIVAGTYAQACAVLEAGRGAGLPGRTFDRLGVAKRVGARVSTIEKPMEDLFFSRRPLFALLPRGGRRMPQEPTPRLTFEVEVREVQRGKHGDPYAR